MFEHFPWVWVLYDIYLSDFWQTYLPLSCHVELPMKLRCIMCTRICLYSLLSPSILLLSLICFENLNPMLLVVTLWVNPSCIQKNWQWAKRLGIKRFLLFICFFFSSKVLPLWHHNMLAWRSWDFALWIAGYILCHCELSYTWSKQKSCEKFIK
jgi:hypothetical protein